MYLFLKEIITPEQAKVMWDAYPDIVQRVIDDRLDDRFIEITEDNRSKLEKILKGEILFTPGHTRDSISLKIDNIVFCGDAAMNGFPSVNRFIIWIEDVLEFERSWNKLIFSGAELIYPAHGAHLTWQI